MLSVVSLLAQAAPDAGGGTNTVRIVAGVLAFAIVVIIILRRKKKASKEDWS